MTDAPSRSTVCGEGWRTSTLSNNSKTPARQVGEEKDQELDKKSSILYLATHKTNKESTLGADINMVHFQAGLNKNERTFTFHDTEQPSYPPRRY